MKLRSFRSPLIPALLMIVAAGVVAAADSEPWQAPARAARKPNPIALSESSIKAGQEVYVKECLSCHGPKGKGDGSAASGLERKPKDLNDQEIWKQTDGAFFWKLTQGRKPMPTYQKTLTEDQRWQVINYSRATFAPKDSASK